MAPRLLHGDLLGVDCWAYRRRGPARGDVVVLRDPREARRRVVKRIVGAPGNDVVIRDGAVLLNGAALDEPYVVGWPPAETTGDGKWQLGEDEWFVLGDNRDGSTDSRVYGPVVGRLMVGRAAWRLRLLLSWRRVR